MIRYTIRRLLWGLLVLFVITVVTFTLFGPVLAGAGEHRPGARLRRLARRPTQAVENMREYLNLDEPYVVQYGLWVKRLVRRAERRRTRRSSARPGENCTDYVGRLGNSFTRTESVDKAIKEAFPVTLSLVTVAAIIWLAVAIPVGVLSAVQLAQHVRPRVDGHRPLGPGAAGLLLRPAGAVLPGLPAELTGLRRHRSASASSCSRSAATRLQLSNPWPWLHHLILPAATLALQFTALYVRMLRSTMLTTMSEDYIRTARAKGVPERTVIYRHGLRNAILPIVTMFGLDLAILLGGSAILTETIFAIPGLGRLAVQGALSLDVALTAGVMLVAALLIVVANIIVDLVYAFVDPRIRLA